MRHSLPLVLAAVVSALLPREAAADPAKSRQLIEDRVLGESKQALAPFGALRWDELEVTTTADGDLVVVPNLRFEGDDRRVEVGRVAFTVAESRAADGSERQRIETELPARVVVESTGAPPLDITCEDQHSVTVWAPELEMFVEADIRYRNVRIADRGGAAEVRLGEAAIETKAETQGDLWSGTTRLALRRVAAASQDVSLALDEVSETFSGTGLSIRGFGALRRKVRELLSTRKPEEIAPDEWLPVIEMADGLSLGDRMRFDVAAKGFRIGGGADVGVGAVALGVGLTRSGGDKADATVDLSVDGLDLAAPAASDLMPDRGSVGLRLLGLPTGRLWAAVTGAARERIRSGDDAGRNLFVAQILDIARSAATSLQLSLALGAPGLSGAAKAEGRFDADAATAIVGQGRVTVQGLDPTLERLRRRPPTDQTRQSLAMLSMIKGFGRSEIANDAIVYIYDVALDRQGTVTINGQDLQSLLRQGQPPAGTPGRPSPPRRRS